MHSMLDFGNAKWGLFVDKISLFDSKNIQKIAKHDSKKPASGLKILSKMTWKSCSSNSQSRHKTNLIRVEGSECATPRIQ